MVNTAEFYLILFSLSPSSPPVQHVVELHVHPKSDKQLEWLKYYDTTLITC